MSVRTNIDASYRGSTVNCVTLACMDYRVQPVKASLVADLVELININLADLMQIKAQTCPDCKGRGVMGGEVQSDGILRDDGTLATCATCGGVGVIERYTLDVDLLKTYRYGRLVEGFEVKQGQLVPKVRSKDRAFAMLTKLLGFDKAVLEIAQGATFTESLSQEQKDAYLDQLKELAQMGLLDGK